MPVEIWTIGHSTRDLESFVDLLEGESVKLVADVRRFPGSRRFPHFNKEELEAGLGRFGILYRHFPEFGGRRGRPAPGSPNTGWRVEAFNAFADYMATPDFEGGLAELIPEAERRRTALMCSEAVPWRCHRRLIADALLVRGWSVLDIIGAGKVEPHQMTAFARISGLQINYPAEPLFPDEGSEHRE
jgi:uncharacterized protein (DUF488 family)